MDQSSSEAGRELYKIFVKGEIFLTDATTAEMVKLMENTYRDINIAAANEFARLADRFHVDIWEAISLANRHPRVKRPQSWSGCRRALHQRGSLVFCGSRSGYCPTDPHRTRSE